MEDKIMSLVRFSNQMPSLLDHLLDNDLFDWSNRNFSKTNTTLPAVNIREDKNGFKVEMSAPGLEKEDFKIELKNSLLTISCEKKEEDEIRENAQYTRKEFSYQSFTRSFNLPEMVENDKIEAKYESGILKVSIPKKEETKPKPSRMIEIM